MHPESVLLHGFLRAILMMCSPEGRRSLQMLVGALIRKAVDLLQVQAAALRQQPVLAQEVLACLQPPALGSLLGVAH